VKTLRAEDGDAPLRGSPALLIDALLVETL
jgi:hypothetical protein